MTELLNVTFTNTNSVGSGGKPYTMYEMRVSSSSQPPWFIFKRYREFTALADQLVHTLQNNPNFNKRNLPVLPRKRININPFAPSKRLIDQRQKQLEEYMRALLKDPNLRRNKPVMDFLDIPTAVRDMIQLQTPRQNLLPQEAHENANPSHKHLNEDELEVDILLKKLYSGSKDRVRALLRFEQWYFMDRGDHGPHGVSMHPHLIRSLLKGYDRYRGLIQSCKTQPDRTAARTCLTVFCKLMDVERNKFARLFTQVFLNLDHSLYREMQLAKHIEDNTSEHAFLIVQLIHEGLPRLDPTVYVNNHEAWFQYEEWREIHSNAFVVGAHYEPVSEENAQSIFNVNDYVSKIKGNDADMDTKTVAASSANAVDDNDNDDNDDDDDDDEDNDGDGEYKDADIDHLRLSTEVFQHFEDFGFESDDEYRVIHKINERYGHMSMNVRCKKDVHWKIKISFTINHDSESIFEFLKSSYVGGSDNVNAIGWHKKLIDRQIVSKLDEHNYIMYEVYKSFNSPYKFRDFVVLRSFKTQQLNEHSKRYFIVCSSIGNYNKMQESKDKLRCVMFPSGFEIRPYNNLTAKTKSQVSYRLHLTSESVNIVTADLLGECDELFESMVRISSLVTVFKRKQRLNQLQAMKNNNHNLGSVRSTSK